MIYTNYTAVSITSLVSSRSTLFSSNYHKANMKYRIVKLQTFVNMSE